MKKRFGIVLSCLVAVILLVLIVLHKQDKANRIEVDDFADKEMGELILINARIDEDMRWRDVDDVRIEHVENMKELNIGYTGYYETLSDIEKCKSLETLVIGSVISGYAHYWGPFHEPMQENEERVIQVQNELLSILNQCSNLTKLCIWNKEKTCEISDLNFLRCKNRLEWLSLEEIGDIDYSPILECTYLEVLDVRGSKISELGEISRLGNLTHLYIDETNIAEVGDILNLTNLEVLNVEDTPLAENEEELALIYETFPDIKLYK